MKAVWFAFACCAIAAPAHAKDLSITVAFDLPKIATVDPAPLNLTFKKGYERPGPVDPTAWNSDEDRPLFIDPNDEYVSVSVPAWHPTENSDFIVWQIQTKDTHDPFPYDTLKVSDGSPNVTGRKEPKSITGFQWTFHRK